MRKFIGIMIFLIAGSTSFSQNLFNGPESVAFDSLYNRYLVSNYNDGSIVQVDTNGNQSYFITGLDHCLGNTIKGNTLYVSVIDSMLLFSSVIGIDLATAQIVSNIYIPCFEHLDGQTADTSGFLYAADTWGGIFKINPVTDEYSIFASGVLIPGLQDIIFDPENNRLLAVSFYQDAPIQGIDLSDSSVYTVVNTSLGYFDGITRDQFGNTYVATHSSFGRIYRYDPEFALGPEFISSGHEGPAGIDYNQRDNILAVPNFYGNTVDFIPIAVTSTGDIETPDRVNFSRNYPNPFNAYTVIEFNLTEPENVTLEIFDNLGRRLGVLLDSDYPAGEHRAIWSPEGLSSGIYFYRINLGRYEQTRKMILLK
ncbi:MAG: T9SS type A sorting domain-containing protein [Candidatus Zixiibacteriota bacterium]|nr:MAG: T9SS type A sorting domain-containing protein [candidate division Zixibacteria bacterium]